MSRTPRLATVTAFAVAISALALGVSPRVAAASADVVVAEAYGGGGNSGAFWRNDFVELFNRSSAPVDLTGWVVRYWSATGTTPSDTPLVSTIAAGGSYLVQQAAGANAAATPLPTPDATGSVAMSSTGARVAVVAPTGVVVDLVGWGAASEAEGSPAGAASNTTSVARVDPCVDHDDNGADFAVGAPTPENSSSSTRTCGGPPPPDPAESIAQIQGAAHLSPLAGTPVNDVEGVVTAVGPSGFWMQDPTPDADVATSDGLAVFTRATPSVAVGDAVLVSGAVTEFRPGGASGTDNLTTTQLAGPRVVVLSSGNPLPAPVVLGVDRVAPQQTVDAEDPGTVEAPEAAYRVERDAIDFAESMEGMLVGVRDARVVGPTASFGEIPVVPSGLIRATTSSAGGVVYDSYAHPNAMRVQLDDLLLPRFAMPLADVGDRLPGLVSGPLDYSFANYKLLVTAPPTVLDGGLARETTAPQAATQLAVATFNVENLSPSNPQEMFDRLAAQVVAHLRSPDILALEEIQDDSGPADDGVVTAGVTVGRLVEAIAAAGGPPYAARWIDPVDGADGGQPGGNIRQVFLHRLDRGVTFVDRAGADAGTAVQVVGTGPGTRLSVSPGRIAPADPAWVSSRKPLVGEFRFRGRTVFVVAVHFASKGGDDPLFGRWQQPERSSEVQRHAQASVVRAFADSLLAADPRALLVVAGDVNDFEFSRTADLLAGSGATALLDLPRTLPKPERWTYVYEGNSQVLDHILLSPALTVTPRGTARAAYDYDIVHVNAAFADQDSDHDPQVVRLTIRSRR